MQHPDLQCPLRSHHQVPLHSPRRTNPVGGSDFNRRPGQFCIGAHTVRVALASRVLLITGGPGVGKTTIVNSILKILLAKDVQIALCAPTGRAAKRLSESTGLEAKTIHRRLEIDPRTGGFRRNEQTTLDCDLLVIDETSMVDVPLMRALLRAVPDEAVTAPGRRSRSDCLRARAGAGRHHRFGDRAGDAPH